MAYFNYHATAKKLIKDGKLISYSIKEKHGNIAPALVLIFCDQKHPIMPIREKHFDEYLNLISEQEKQKNT